MQKGFIIPALCCAVLLFPSLSSAAPKSPEPAAVEETDTPPGLLEMDKSEVRRFFLKHADLVLEAGKLSARREQAAKTGRRMLQEALTTPVPASATVLYAGQEPIVLFTDFFCGNCRGYAALLHETFPDADISLRFLPPNEGIPAILARWALAAYERDRNLFPAFHHLIEENIQHLAASESIEAFQEKIEELAGKAGYDARLLRQLLSEKSEAYDARLKEDVEWAKTAGIMATPGLVWGDGRHVLIGRATPDMLRFFHNLLRTKKTDITPAELEKAFPAE